MRTFVFSFLLVSLAACQPADPWTFHGEIPMDGKLVYKQ